jgi:hypothetical protein
MTHDEVARGLCDLEQHANGSKVKTAWARAEHTLRGQIRAFAHDTDQRLGRPPGPTLRAIQAILGCRLEQAGLDDLEKVFRVLSEWYEAQ